MIRLTRINHLPLVLNSDLIEHVEITPDTVIAMTSGQKYMVLESADEVIERVIDFRRTIANLPAKASTIRQNVEPASAERS
jgi:flagellar protein FlbD